MGEKFKFQFEKCYFKIILNKGSDYGIVTAWNNLKYTRVKLLYIEIYFSPQTQIKIFTSKIDQVGSLLPTAYCLKGLDSAWK